MAFQSGIGSGCTVIHSSSGLTFDVATTSTIAEADAIGVSSAAGARSAKAGGTKCERGSVGGARGAACTTASRRGCGVKPMPISQPAVRKRTHSVTTLKVTVTRVAASNERRGLVVLIGLLDHDRDGFADVCSWPETATIVDEVRSKPVVAFRVANTRPRLVIERPQAVCPALDAKDSGAKHGHDGVPAGLELLFLLFLQIVDFAGAQEVGRIVEHRGRLRVVVRSSLWKLGLTGLDGVRHVHDLR